MNKGIMKGVMMGSGGSMGIIAVFLLALCVGMAPSAYSSAQDWARTAQFGVAQMEKAVTFADMDGDLDTDIVIGYQSNEWTTATGAGKATFTIRWFRNNGTGNAWTEPYAAYVWTPDDFNAVAFASFNKCDWLSDIKAANINSTTDTQPDIVFCTHAEGVRWVRNLGGGNLGTAAANPPSAIGPARTVSTSDAFYPNVRKVLPIDLDLDGDVDVAYAQAETGGGPNQGSVIRVYYGNGGGTFIATSTNPLLASELVPFVVTLKGIDLTNDGRPEIVATGIGTSGSLVDVVRVIPTSGTNAGIVKGTDIQLSAGYGADPFDVGVGYIDGDAILDLVVISSQAPTVTWYKGNNTTNPGFGGQINSSRAGVANAASPRNDYYPVFGCVTDWDRDGDSDVFVSYFATTTAADGEVVYYENSTGWPLGNPTAGVNLPISSGTPDRKPMNVDMATTHVAGTVPAGYPDTYQDLVVAQMGPSLFFPPAPPTAPSGGSGTVSFWNNTTYSNAPYVVSATVLGARTIQVVFSKSMNTTQALTTSMYSLSPNPPSTGRGTLQTNPNSVTGSGTTYTLTWPLGQSMIQSCGSTLDVVVNVDKTMQDTSGYQLRAPRSATATYSDIAAPTVIVQASISRNLSSPRVWPADLNNGTYDNFDGAMSFLVGRSNTGPWVAYIDVVCGDRPSTTLYLQATDACGNAAVSGGTTVNVTDDIKPTATCQTSIVHNLSVGSTLNATECNNGSSDNCGAITYWIRDHSVGGAYSNSLSVGPCSGVLVVDFVVRDTALNESDACQCTVNIEDDIDPSAVCTNFTVVLDAIGMGTLQPGDIDGGSTDNCGVTHLGLTEGSLVDQAQLPYYCDDVGSHAVTLVVRDAENNEATCPATVTVADNQIPIAACLATHSVNLDSLLGTVVLDASALENGSNDNCALTSLVRRLGDSNPPTPTVTLDCGDVVGGAALEYFVRDSGGNLSAPCSVAVDVNDITPPVIGCQDFTVELDIAGAGVLLPADILASSTDNCPLTYTLTEGALVDVAQITYGCDDIAGSPHTVTLKATDPGGNSTTCQAEVTVEDNVAPTVVTQNISVTLDSVTGTATIAEDAVDNGSTDACGIDSYDTDITSFDCGDTAAPVTVTLMVTDIYGNSDTATAQVTVEDTTPPDAVAKNITVTVEEPSGTVTITGSDIDGGSTDNCDSGGLTFDADPDTFDCDDVGTIVSVTLTVTDPSSNTDTAIANVTVVDTTGPTPLCKSGILDISLTGSTESVLVSDIDDGSSDACGIKSLVVSPDTVGCSDIGNDDLWVTLTVTDNHDNVDTCQRQVRVTESTPPTAVCNEHTIDLAGATYVLTGDDIAAISAGSTDNCGIKTREVAPDTFGCAELGDQTVTLTITDTSDNTDTCTATLHVTTSVFTVEDPAPSPQDKYDGDSATLSAMACGGSGGYTFEWYFIPSIGGTAQLLTDGNPHPADGATTVSITNVGGTSTLALGNLKPATDGEYRLEATSGTETVGCANNGILNVHAAVEVTAPEEVAPGPLYDMHGNTGDTFRMSVTASEGFAPYTYLWFKDPNANGYELGEELSDTGQFSGTTTDTLQITGLALTDAGDYGCIAYDKYYQIADVRTWKVGATSALTVTDLLAVGDPVPALQYIYVGEDASFTVTASGGAGAYSYEWLFEGNPIGNGALPSGAVVSGADTPTITITGAQLSEDGMYSCRVDDESPDPEVTSGTARLDVREHLTIQTPPQDTTKNESETATFTVVLTPDTGIPDFFYEWQWWDSSISDWLPLVDGPHPGDPDVGEPRSTISGAATDTLSIWLSDNGILVAGDYRVRVWDSWTPPDEVISDPATLTVTNFMDIVVLPLNVRAYENVDAVTFTAVVMNGIPPYTYQWYHDSQELLGENSPLLSLGFADAGEAGDYVVEVDDSSPLNPPEHNDPPAVLEVAAVPTLAGPEDVWAYEGTTATFTVGVNDGFPPFTYDWREGGVSLGAPDSENLALTGVTIADDDGRAFDVLVDDTGSTISGVTHLDSDEATLHVGTALTFDGPVEDFSAYNDEPTFKLHAFFQGGFGLDYNEWKRRVAGNPAEETLTHSTTFNGNSLSLTVNPASGDGSFEYFACITDRVQTTCSDPGDVILAKHVEFVTELVDTTTLPGDPVELFVEVDGGLEPITYAWFKNDGSKIWQSIPGDTNTQSFPDPETSDSGRYRVEVTEGASTRGGSPHTITSEATLTVSLGVPVGGPLGLLLLTALTSLAGAAALRRKK
ncbi:MAG TPA: FG-GAP-like repeat-containing protein [Candidatus Hydrogenedentes bacterium]|nr:FG-GAP-like repeat-containing protein [Candidatus Hydrogenedentota bacterium]